MSDDHKLRDGCIIECEGEFHHVRLDAPHGNDRASAILTCMPLHDGPTTEMTVRRVGLSLLEAAIAAGDVTVLPRRPERKPDAVAPDTMTEAPASLAVVSASSARERLFANDDLRPLLAKGLIFMGAELGSRQVVRSDGESRIAAGPSGVCHDVRVDGRAMALAATGGGSIAVNADGSRSPDRKLVRSRPRRRPRRAVWSRDRRDAGDWRPNPKPDLP